MRKGWRNALGLLLLLLLTQDATGARVGQISDSPIGMTVEIAWNETPRVSYVVENTDPTNASEIQLEAAPGEIKEAIGWPSGTVLERLPSGALKLGAERSGRARVRFEGPLASSLLIRVGNGPPVRFPVAMILEGPRRAPSQSGVEVTVERLAWDPINLQVDEPNASGVASPGSKVPISVGFNLISSESAEALVLCTAELKPIRGGPALWTYSFRETVATNTITPARLALPIQMPMEQGTYVVTFRVEWEPLLAHDGGTALGRILRRSRRNLFNNFVGGVTGVTIATRKVTLAVVDPAEKANDPLASPARLEHDQEVDAIELGKLRGNQRPTASGRSKPLNQGLNPWVVPEEALAESPRRDRLRGWITRGPAELSKLAPADANGYAWSALGLKVNHPGRPHRLNLAVSGGHPTSLAVALIGPSGGSGRPRLLLDACASGPPVLPDGSPVSFSWLVWPDSIDPVLVLVNRAGVAPVELGAITLTELAEIPSSPGIEEPPGLPHRDLGLDLTGPNVLERFGIGDDAGLTDVVSASRSLAQYLNYCGTSVVVLSETLADRSRRQALGGQAAEDPIGPDPLALTLATLGRRNIKTWLDLSFDGNLPGLPPPNSAEAKSRGLVRIDRRGTTESAEYHILNREVRDAMKQRVVEVVAAHKPETGAKLAGILIRLGRGPTLLGAPDTGLDDPTFNSFISEAFDPETAKRLPGLNAKDANRLDARSKFIAGSGRMPWLTYRSKQVADLYVDLAKAARETSKDVQLALSTPGLSPGSAGAEARKADLNDLAPSLAWRAIGFDLDAWPVDETAPILLRGISLSTDDLAHDLATHSELDAKVLTRTNRGVIIEVDDVEPSALSSKVANESGSSSATSPKPDRPHDALVLSAVAMDDGPVAEEPLGHAVAALDARWVVVASPAISGHEERLRSFAKVFRALPAPTGIIQRQPIPFGVSVRTISAKDQTYLALANDTPYPIRLDTLIESTTKPTIYDFARSAMLKPEGDASGRHLVLDLLPFGVASFRVQGADIKVGAITPYPAESVITTMEARYNELSSQLTRLSRGNEKDRNTPPNPGFEPTIRLKETGMETKVVSLKVKPDEGDSEPSNLVPGGWAMLGDKANLLTIDLKQPRSGRGSLRLDAKARPASAASETFHPNIHSAILVKAWLRADRADTKVRVWIEGESAGKPFQRVSELKIGNTWTERAVRASDVPSGGLDSARIRFELNSEGSLWIDDLNVSGESLTEPERRNARNALLAALQAYREKRYADFARLSGSHWARHPGVTSGSAASRISEGETPPRPGLGRVGDASPLPQERRLR